LKLPGEEFLSKLKNPDILKRKPDLKLMPNHYKEEIHPNRIWNEGTAIRDGHGWYKRKS
jgi:hypothetical protein